MNRRNFDDILMQTVRELNGRKPTLLLHACCAPCSSACLERLKDHFGITVLFYNPNIEDEEYELRKSELVRLLDETGWAKICDCDHETKPFYDAVKGLEDAPEGGARCAKCFALRLERCAQEAEKGGFEYFGTTLTVSPLKDAALVNALGESIARTKNVRWLYADFKKRDGYLRSIRLSEEYGLYRQNFCGCIYSQKALEKSGGA